MRAPGALAEPAEDAVSLSHKDPQCTGRWQMRTIGYTLYWRCDVCRAIRHETTHNHEAAVLENMLGERLDQLTKEGRKTLSEDFPEKDRMTYPRKDALGTLVRRIRASGRAAAAAQDPTVDPVGWCLWVGDDVIARGQTRDEVAEAGERWLQAADTAEQDPRTRFWRGGEW